MTADRAIDLSVILVNWNSRDVTADALESLRRHTTGIAYEVFVVDNGTTKDDGPATLPERFPWAEFLFNDANLGFTKANNQGLRRSAGRHVLLLNNDTVQTGNALGEAVRYMDAHPEVGVLGIEHLNADATNSHQPSVHAFPKPWREIVGLLGLGRRRPAPAAPAPPAEGDVDWVCGSFLMVRRECLEQVGELDERFFTYEEDIDWCLRARQAGWRVRYWPGTSMVHLGAASSLLAKDKTFIIFRSHLSYIRKHHGLAAAAGYYTAMSVRLGLASLKQSLRLALGRASLADLNRRLARQWQFLSLSSGRRGG